MEIAMVITIANLYPDPKRADGTGFYLSGHWIQHGIALLLLDENPPTRAVTSWDVSIIGHESGRVTSLEIGAASS